MRQYQLIMSWTELRQQELGQPQTLYVAELHTLIQLLGSISVVMGASVMVSGIGYLVVSYLDELVYQQKMDRLYFIIRACTFD